MATPSFFLFGPQGSGKSRNAQQLAELLGCTSIVDEWQPGQPVPEGALVLSNLGPEQFGALGVASQGEAHQG